MTQYTVEPQGRPLAVMVSIATLEQLVAERDTLRAELAAIAATEPVMFAYEYSDGSWHDASSTEHSAGMKPLFTRPMPAQDVTELVDALEDLKRQYSEHPDAFWDWSKARAALSKYKGAK